MEIILNENEVTNFYESGWFLNTKQRASKIIVNMNDGSTKILKDRITQTDPNMVILDEAAYDPEKVLQISSPMKTEIDEDYIPDDGINVLSLFDGISTARLVLDDLGIKVKSYFSSEINKPAISISEKHFPSINRVGSITELKAEKDGLYQEYGEIGGYIPIDFMCGGSSCQNFSFAGQQEGMVTKEDVKIESLEQYLHYKENGFEFKGESYLFWEYVRLLRDIKPKKFFLENVKMSKYNKDMITDALVTTRYPKEKWKSWTYPEERVKYVNEDSRITEYNSSEKQKFQNIETGEVEIFSVNYINSGMFSAQTRRRIYWTNIDIDPLPEKSPLVTSDIVKTIGDEEDILSEKQKSQMKEFGSPYSFGGRTVDLDKKFTTITASYGKASGNGGKVWLRDISETHNITKIPEYAQEDNVRILSLNEIEKVMGMPEGYTDGLPRGAAIKCLGNGWERNTIKFLWKNL